MPEYKDSLEFHFNQFSDSLDKIHKNIEEILKLCNNGKLFVFHPTFGYFADRYGLNQVAIEIEGKEPNAKDLSELIKLAKEEKIKTIFVQPQFSTKSAEAVAKEIDARVVIMDPLSSDYFDNLVDIAHKIAESLNCHE
jgi:zinc transport system substrate-binding protein